jgi:serine/threonine protein kinase
MAVVYLARQPGLDRLVALKELAAFGVEDQQMVHRFLRESRIAGSLNHPNIVTVYEAESPVALLLQQVSNQPPPPLSVNPALEPEIGAWIERLLVKDPAARTPTAEHASAGESEYFTVDPRRFEPGPPPEMPRSIAMAPAAPEPQPLPEPQPEAEPEPEPEPHELVELEPTIMPHRPLPPDAAAATVPARRRRVPVAVWLAASRTAPAPAGTCRPTSIAPPSSAAPARRR